jgi:hypothetical protein
MLIFDVMQKNGNWDKKFVDFGTALQIYKSRGDFDKPFSVLIKNKIHYKTDIEVKGLRKDGFINYDTFILKCFPRAVVVLFDSNKNTIICQDSNIFSVLLNDLEKVYKNFVYPVKTMILSDFEIEMVQSYRIME